MPDSCLNRLVGVLDEIQYVKIPDDVTERAMQCFMDFCGILYGGSKKEMSVKLKECMERDHLPNEEDLALWMASSARTLDLDDGHRYAMAHPGVVIQAAAIAVSVHAKEKISGAQFLEAVIKGYEVYCYQGRIINPGAYLKRGIDATCACGAGAAAAVTASLLGYDHKQMEDAISLAAAIAGGLNQSAIDGSAQKYLVAGYGAKIGISAAKIAGCGLGGPEHIFEGKLGYANAFCPEPNREVMEHPYIRWDVANTYLKIHACVRRIHATLDAVKKIMNAHELKEQDIVKVNVFGGPFLCDAATYEPKDAAQAQTSVPYTTAILMKYGCVMDDLVEENIENPEIHKIMEKIQVCPDEEIKAMGEKDKSLWGAARVVIEAADGKKYEELKTVPDGERETPFAEKIILEKFVRNTEAVLGKKNPEELWNQLKELPECSDVRGMLEKILAPIAFWKE